MLKTAKAFSSFSVDDLDKAKQFYAEVLGLDAEERPEGLALNVQGSDVFVYPKPNHEPATFTVLNFEVEDIDQVVDDLQALGVKFEHYDSEMLKTDQKGICRNKDHKYPGPVGIAWFTDPAGNILSVLQES